MDWTPEAEAAIKKVPFFVRKKIRNRVEQEAKAAGKAMVTLAVVCATQQRFLSNMTSEIKGFQIDACFGQGGCPNRVIDTGHVGPGSDAHTKAGLLKHRERRFLKAAFGQSENQL